MRVSPHGRLRPTGECHKHCPWHPSTDAIITLYTDTYRIRRHCNNLDRGLIPLGPNMSLEGRDAGPGTLHPRGGEHRTCMRMLPRSLPGPPTRETLALPLSYKTYTLHEGLDLVGELKNRAASAVLVSQVNDIDTCISSLYINVGWNFTRCRYDIEWKKVWSSA